MNGSYAFGSVWGTVVGPTGGSGMLEGGFPFWIVALGVGSLLVGSGVVVLRWCRSAPSEPAMSVTRSPPPQFPPPGPTDEERVVRLLESNGGRMPQARIVERTGWSKAKVSLLLSEMESDGTIRKLPVGRENLISLPGAEPVP